MRKLLLATVAVLGASMGAAAYADAQVVTDDSTDGQAYPTPGTVTVRLNGRFREYAYVADQGALRTTNYGVTGVNGTTSSTGAAVGATAAAGGVNAQGSNRLSNYGFEGYARIYPGFDGVAANGLKYGASIEIRQDNAFGAGGGTDGSVSSTNRDRGELYIRREWGYIGTDRLGSVRFGSSDQPSSLFLTGTGENFDDGGLNGDLPGFLANGGAYVYPFADVGNLYSTEKAVYLSPQLYGVDFGLSYEPSTAAAGEDNSGCGGTGNLASGNTLITSAAANAAAPGCDALSSTSTGDVARRKDTYEGLARYRGTFGAFGVVGTASYDGSGRVHDSGVVGSTIDPQHSKMEDLSVYDFGLAVTYGGLTVSGNYQRGRYNVPGGGGFGGLVTHGQPDANAYSAAISYTIGSLVVGGSFSESWYQGNQQAATNQSTYGVPLTGSVTGGQRRDTGAAVGATYSLAPGVALYLSGIWMEAHQRGFNFVTGAANVGSGSTTDAHNKLDQSVLAFGTSFAW
jgi:hypothetical protein